MQPVQQQVQKQLSSASLRVSDAIAQAADPATKEQVSNTANQIFMNVSNWYTAKKEQFFGESPVEGSYESITSQTSKKSDE